MTMNHQRKKLLLFVIFLFLYITKTFTQSLPVIQASSNQVDVRDGLHFKKG